MKEKIAMAFRAMEALGIGRERVKPVLKRLLQEFDNQWEHIEAESYRALADAIFEAQDSQEGCSADNKKASAAEKSHRKKRLKPSEGDGPTRHPPQNIIPSQTQSTSLTSNKSVRNVPNGTALALVESKNNSAAMPRDDDVAVARSSRGALYQDRSLINLAEPKMEPESECEQPGFMPLAVVLPSYVPDSSANSYLNRSSKGKVKEKGKALLESDETAQTNVEITATTTGDVNLSFICHDNLINNPNFQPPSIDDVCRDVEDRCLASYKILDPKFSLRNVLNEMCRSFSALGYAQQQQQKRSNGYVINIVPAPGAEHIFEGLSRNPFTSLNPSSSMFNMAMVYAPTPHCAEDISRGEEIIQISIERGIGSSDEYPPHFHYIAKNIPYQNAYISIYLARIGDDSCCSDCFDDCLKKPFGCACSSETAGVFAYTEDGLLKAEFLDACMKIFHEPKRSNYVFCKEDCPLERVKNDERPEKCKGHLMRKFIKECWAKCGCKRQCGNRVVQRGITCNLQVFNTGHHKGWGLRTKETLPRGKFVCEYVGEILTNIELYDRQRSSRGKARHTYPVLLDADWSTEGVLKDEEALCLDGTYYGNIARFINHRCFDGNLIGIPVEIETPDHHYYHLAFFTTREVSAMEELTWDYGIDFDDDKHPIEAFRCRCGSKFCRDNKGLAKARSRKLILS